MSTAGKRLIASAKQARDFAAGAENGCKVHVPLHVDVAAIRKKAKMTQAQFAETYGFKIRTLQQWERGARTPEDAARNYLAIIEAEPDTVLRILGQAD